MSVRGRGRRGRETTLSAAVAVAAVAVLVAVLVAGGPWRRDGARARLTSPTSIAPTPVAPSFRPRTATRPVAAPAPRVAPSVPATTASAATIDVATAPTVGSNAVASEPAIPVTAATEPAEEQADDAPVSAASPTWAPYAGPSYDTEEAVLTLEDPSRDTPDRGEEPGHPGRSLPTLLLRPVGVKEPLPLVVFAHGYNSEPAVYETLLETWAAAGYLVAAPELPGSARDLPGEPTESDIAQQALDLSYVITAVLHANVGADPRAIAVAGHSDGGTTVATLAVDDSYGDPRVGAYLVLSGAAPDDVGGGPSVSGAAQAPMLVTVGTNDEYDDAPAARQLYAAAALPKALVVVSGGDHLGMYLGDTAVDQHLRDTTLEFLDGTLRHDRGALDNLDVTLESGLTS